ncbi:MAG: hypothetical protein FJY77_05645, partial [Candidatus Altiarchaeales archaeon]|nr:hypothetical protein [Candidatus Altiarchaeales archaeon]
MPVRHAGGGEGNRDVSPSGQLPQSVVDTLIAELKRRPVPDFIRAKRELAESQARVLFPVEEKLDGDKPAIVHRDKEAFKSLPPEVREQIDRVVTSRFESLAEGRDYSRKSGSMLAPGNDYARSLVIDLDRPVTVSGLPIQSIKLKGAAFKKGHLDREFDLFRAQHELMGRQVSPLFVRMDFHFPESGIVEAIPHVNEPLGAEFLFETVGEARNGKRMMESGVLVDLPLCWYEYDQSIRPPSGLRLGVMATGAVPGSRVNIGVAMHDLYQEYSPKIAAGDRAAIAEWKRKTEELYTQYVRSVSGLHAGGKGFFHESPHPAQFHVLDGDLNRILVSDIGSSESLAGMSYAQRIACMAHDLKSVLAFAAHYEQNPLASAFGFDFFGMSFKYFDKVDDAYTLETLKKLSRYGPSGRILIEGMFQDSSEQRRPIISFKDNPLVKVLTQQ